MGLIFLMSSRWMAFGMSADATEAWFGVLNYVVRKLAHLGEYAILTYLWLRSIWTEPRRFGPCLAWSAVLSVCYAVTDEFHQYAVPERLGTWTDVLYDARRRPADGLSVMENQERRKRGIETPDVRVPRWCGGTRIR